MVDNSPTIYLTRFLSYFAELINQDPQKDNSLEIARSIINEKLYPQTMSRPNFIYEIYWSRANCVVFKQKVKFRKEQFDRE